MSRRRYARIAATCAAVVLGGCHQEATGPAEPGASFATGAPVTVQVLPAPLNTAVQMYGVSSGGYIFATYPTASGGFSGYAWTRPYTAQPEQMPGILGTFETTRNSLGDIPGAIAGSGDGVFLRNASSWDFILPDRGAFTSALVRGLNDARAMVGNSFGGGPRALWWSDPAAPPTTLPAPAVSGVGGSVIGRVMNNAGTLVGTIDETVGSGRHTQTLQHGVVWTQAGGAWTAALLPDMANANTPRAMNDAGQVLVVLGSAPGAADGTGLWSPAGTGYSTTIVSTTWIGAGLDRCGRIVGQKLVQKKRTAVLWDNGVTTTLPLPAGYAEAEAVGITTDAATGEGVIVGRAFPRGNGAVAVRWTVAGCP